MSQDPSSPYMDNTPIAGGSSLPMKPAINVALPALVGTMQLVTGKCVLMGFSFRESTGLAAAQIDLYENAAQTGNLIATISLNARESSREWLGPQGIDCSSIVAVVVSGSVAGTTWVVLP